MDYPLEAARALLDTQSELRPARSVLALTQARKFLEWAGKTHDGVVNRQELETSFDILDVDALRPVRSLCHRRRRVSRT